jgi:hypothetical protein
MREQMIRRKPLAHPDLQDQQKHGQLLTAFRLGDWNIH